MILSQYNSFLENFNINPYNWLKSLSNLLSQKFIRTLAFFRAFQYFWLSINDKYALIDETSVSYFHKVSITP